jgi:CheY-like chemotaxis protein
MSTTTVLNSRAPGHASASHAIILIVEDNDEIRMVLKDTLTELGYPLVEARDGSEAVARFATASPSLVLLDLQLPDMTGWEVLTRFREINPDATVLVLSGSSTEDVTELAKNSGAAGYVPKPFSAPALLSQVHSLLAPNRTSHQGGDHPARRQN